MDNQTNPKLVKIKKVDFVFDISKQLQAEIKKSKYIKWSVGIVATVGMLYALGFVFKVLNFTARNYKDFNATLRNKNHL